MKKIGRYVIETELGRGGFGRVYRAYDPVVGRPVAIKVLTAQDDDDQSVRFRNEATASGRLVHKNIVTVHDFGQEGAHPYIVMELIEGRDLSQILKDEPQQLDLSQKLDIIYQTTEGLQAAHRIGIVHRDIKPANIMVLPSGLVKILDFGIARWTGSAGTRLTRPGYLIGSIHYMSPEQFQGLEVDERSDIFSLGVVAYQVLTGKHPFSADTQAAVIYNVTQVNPPPLTEHVPDLPPELDGTILTALCKDRELRHPSVEDMRLDLQPVLFELKRREAEGLMIEVENLLGRDDAAGALSILRKVLRLDPAHPRARKLRREAETQASETRRSARTRRLIDEGNQLLEQRDFDGAGHKFREALALDADNEEIKKLLEDSRERAVSVRHARRVFEKANKLMAQGDAAAADSALDEALASDPELTNAPKLRDRVRAALEDEKRRRRLEQTYAHARECVASERFDEARLAIESLREQGCDRESAAALEAELERGLELHHGIAQARERISEEAFESAVRRLEHLRIANPDRLELADLLTEAQARLADRQKRRAIDELRTSVAADIAEERFAEALAAIRRARREHGDGPELDRLEQDVQHARAARERRAKIDEARKQASRAEARGRFDEALTVLEDVQRSVGHDTGVERLHYEIAQRREARRREAAIQELAERNRARIEAEQFAEAIAELESEETSRLGQPGQLTELLERARAGLDRQLRERQAERAAERARNLAAELSFSQAIKLLERTRLEIADTPSLRAALREIRAAEAAHLRDQAIEQALSKGRSALERMEYEQAASDLDEALREVGPDPRLSELRAEIGRMVELARREKAVRRALEEAQRLDAAGQTEQALKHLQEQEERLADGRLAEAARAAQQKLKQQRRARLVSETVDEANGLLANGDPQAALDLLRARGELDGEPLIEARRERAKAEADTLRRRREVHAALDEASKLARAGRHDQALATLDRALASYPDAEALLREKAEVEASRERRECERAVAQALAKASGLERSGRFVEALDELNRCLGRYPSEPTLVMARSALDVAREQAQILEKARKSIAASDYSAALTLLQPAVERWPSAEDLAEALADAQRLIAERRREELVADIVERADALAGQSRFIEALRLVDDGLEQEPGSEALRLARKRIAQRREDHERNELVQTVLRKAEESGGSGILEEALARIEAALELAPHDSRLIAAKNRISRTLDDRRRAQAIEAAMASGRRLLNADQLDEAVKLLQGVNEQCSGTPELEELLALCENRKKGRDGERTIQKVLSETARLAESQRYGDALQKIRSTASEYPDDERLAQRESELSRAREGLERRQRIDQALETARRQARESTFDGALAALDRALERDPGDEGLQKLHAEVEEQRRAATERRLREQLDQIDHRLVAANARPADLRKLAKEADAIAARLLGETELQERCRETRRGIAEALEQAKKTAGFPVRRVAAGIGAAAAVAAVLVLSRPEAGPTGVPLALEVSPAGATVQLGEQSCVVPGCALSAPAGEHTLRVAKPGYAPVATAISIPPDQVDTWNVEVTLEALPSVIELVTDLESGRVSLDDRPPESLENGKWSVLDLAPGAHRLRVESGRTQAEIAFQTIAGAPPEVRGGASAQDASVLGVSRLRGEGRAFATGAAGPAQLDGKPIGSIGPAGLELGNLTAENEHTFTLGQGDDERRVIFDVPEAPVLSLYLFSDRSVGSVVVRTGQPGARVQIGDRTFQTERDGSVRALLDIGSYTIRATKEGFRAANSKTVEIRKGIEQSLEIELQPVNPLLSVQGGEPGAELRIDGERKAELDASGDASIAVEAGPHEIEIRKEGFRSQRFNRNLQPGRSIVLEGADVQLARIPPPPPSKPSLAERQEQEYLDAFNQKDWNKLIAIRNDPNHPRARDAAEALRERDRVRDQSNEDEFLIAKANEDLAKLQEIAGNPSHPSARDAAELLLQLRERKEIDDAIASGDITGLRNVIAKYPNGVHTARAQLRLNDLLRQDREALLALLLRYSDAFTNQDLAGIQAAWPTLPSDTIESLREAFKDRRNSARLVFQPVEDPKISSSDQATWQCRRTAIGASGRRAVNSAVPVEVDFVRRDGRWVIQAMREIK